uniref:SUEL-type lectin domain-containing protein n=1 Tax=Oncorhynchus tshawytscha TaxID=74940 RepID=A0A8C8D2W5_ONCTS
MHKEGERARERETHIHRGRERETHIHKEGERERERERERHTHIHTQRGRENDVCVCNNTKVSLTPSSKPDEYKSKVACEEERMKLTCKRGMQIAVYSAMFGRTQQGTLECPTHHRRVCSSLDCQSGVALQVLTTRCQGKQSCFVQASTQAFGDPCYSGTRKYLSAIYACGESPVVLTPEQHRGRCSLMYVDGWLIDTATFCVCVC